MPSISFQAGQLISVRAIPQIAAAANGHDTTPEFWTAFIAGIAGAMAASIGFDAAEKVLRAQLVYQAEARDLINKNTH